MELGPVTKLDKRNTGTSKKVSNAVSSNCDSIVVFDQFGAVKLKFSLIVTFYLAKPEHKIKKS